jgi:hypothetical protein
MRRILAGCTAFVIAIGIASTGSAQVGAWVEVNSTYAIPASSNIVQHVAIPFRQETFQATFGYPESSTPSADFSGGVRIGPHLGVGVGASRYSSGDQAGNVSLVVPHPLLFNRPATDAGVTQHPMLHQETAIHLEGRYIVNTRRLGIAAFGGPSFFRTKQDILSDVDYDETLMPGLAYRVQLTGVQRQSVERSTWGFNVGADVGVFFTRHLGAGVLARYARARVDLPNELQSAADNRVVVQTVPAGGFNIGGGLRLRF